MLRNRLFLCFFTLSVALAFVSCHRKTVYYQFRHAMPSGWERNDTLFFNVQKASDRDILQEEVALRVNQKYPFMGLCLIIDQTTYPSGITVSDTLNCNLINEDGTFKGDGISHYQYQFPVKELYVAQGDSLHISIRHNMKREILPGIADVGLILRSH